MLYLDEIDLYIEKITAEQYLKYLSYVDDTSIDNTEKKYLIVHTLTNIDMNTVSDFNIWDIESMYLKLYFYILDNIESKYIKICEDAMGLTAVKKEKSFFDDYDKENGYIEESEEKKLTKSDHCKQMINTFIRYMSKNHNLSYEGFMNSDLSELLDNIYYNLKYDKEHEEGR